MRGTIAFNGWRILARRKVRPGLFVDSYVSSEGWKAEALFGGVGNRFLGLRVTDETGKFVGVVQNVTELP